MGHVLTKEVNGETLIVNLVNIVRPADIMDVQDGGLIETTYLTYEQMLENKEEWAKEWDEIEQLKSVLDSMERKLFRVYEWWTMDKFMVAGEEKYTRGCIKFLDKSMMESVVSKGEDAATFIPACELSRDSTSPYFEKINNKKLLAKLEKQGLIEFGDKKNFPYEEERLVTVPGRWMGMGYYKCFAMKGRHLTVL